MFNIKLLLVLALPFFWSKGFCGSITIKYILEKDSTYSKVKIKGNILEIIKNGWDHRDPDNLISIPFEKTFVADNEKEAIIIIKYHLKSTGCYFLREGLGHELLIEPVDDTIEVHMRPISSRINFHGKNVPSLNDSVLSSWGWNVTFPDKYKYIGFFDSLACLQGDIQANMHYTLKALNNDLSGYLQYAKHVYDQRMKFYQDFIRRHYMPEKLKYYAMKEIQYAYYFDLLDPVSWKFSLYNEYSSQSKDSIKNVARELNDSDLFSHICHYRSVVIAYISISQRANMKNDSGDSLYFINAINYSKEHCSGEIYNYAIVTLMEQATRSDSKEVYKMVSKNFDRNGFDSGVKSFANSLDQIAFNSSNLDSNQVLNFNFDNEAGTQSTLGTHFNKKLIVIDCWATWCGPCLNQTPYLDTLIDLYSDKIQFVAVSADHDKSKWVRFLATGNYKKNNKMIYLHAQGGFENIFFRLLLVNTIPRYILFSKNGRILNPYLPLPSDRIAFESEIRKYL